MDTNTSDYINDATLQSIIDQSTTADGLINSTQFVQLVNSQQSGTNSRHPLDFPACWAKQIDSSGNWMLVFGGFMIFYCFLLTSKRELIWRILLIHGVCGMIAALLDTAFSALRECGNIPKNTALIWGLIIAQHSLGWVWHETAVVAYSFLKTETIVSNTISKRCMRGLMMFLFAGFLVCHALIVKSRINNENFSQIQAYAYIISGTAELVILALLVSEIQAHLSDLY